MHTIYSYGGGEYLYYVFNFVSALVSPGTSGLSTNIIRMVSLFGVSWAILKMYAKNSVTPGIAWFMWFTMASFLVVGPRGTIRICDPISYGSVYKTVDNVPLILAAGASSFSSIGHEITKKIESVFIIPGSRQHFKYIETGSLFGSKVIKKLEEVQIEDPIFKGNLNRFVQQCVVYDAMIGKKYDLKMLRETDDIWNLVSKNASRVLGFLYKDRENKGIVTCQEGAQKLNQQWNEVIGEVATTQGMRLFGNKRTRERQQLARSAREAFLINLPASYEMFSGISSNGFNIIKQQMMIHALREGPSQKADQLGSHYAVAKATLQQRNSYKIAGLMAEESLIVMRAVFETLIYGSFIFVYILIFLPSGYRLLGYYFQAICWIQLWAPLYAILNFIMSLWGYYETQGVLAGSGLSRANSAALIDLHTDVAGLAGWLSLSVPYISFMLINKGGVSAFVQLASQLGSTIGSSVASVSSEKTSGNVSLGNFSQGNLNLQTTSAYKHNTSADFQSGQFSRNLGSGAIKMTNPEGNVYLGGAGRSVSTFATDVMDSKYMAMQLNKHAQYEKSLMHGKSADYSTQIANTQRDVAELIERIANNEINMDSYTKDLSYSEVQTLQRAVDFSKKVQEKYGLSASASADLSVGRKFGMLELSGKLGGRGEWSRDKIEDFAKSEGYRENLDSIVRATKALKFDDVQSREKALVQQINSSYEKANMLRESVSVHQQNADRLGRAATFMESSNYDTRTIMNQEFLKYIAESKGTNTQGRIGYDTAASIVDSTSGPLLERKEELLQRFQEDRTQKMVDYFKSHEIKDGTDLDHAFQSMHQTLSIPQRDHSEIMNHSNDILFNEDNREQMINDNLTKQDIYDTEKRNEMNKKRGVGVVGVVSKKTFAESMEE